ncbi:hypothetical protein BLJAPNOD_02945 [Ensifer sp. M14]|nr:hypothetical protein BLJAPNOD_02945 [Ensifer sp. M14]
MVWVKYTANHNWEQPGFTIAYRAGMHLNVTRACADEAVERGVAVRTAAPKQTRESADGKKAH